MVIFFSFCLCLCINRQDLKSLYYKDNTVLYSMNVNKPVKQAAIETLHKYIGQTVHSKQ